MAKEVQPIVSPRSMWVEDTYHNTLPEVFVRGKTPTQGGKRTLLERISGSISTFLGGIKLPPVTVEHEIPSADTSTKGLMFGALALAALYLIQIKKR
jgi:hypothetical protein